CGRARLSGTQADAPDVAGAGEVAAEAQAGGGAAAGGGRPGSDIVPLKRWAHSEPSVLKKRPAWIIRNKWPFVYLSSPAGLLTVSPLPFPHSRRLHERSARTAPMLYRLRECPRLPSARQLVF